MVWYKSVGCLCAVLQIMWKLHIYTRILTVLNGLQTYLQSLISLKAENQKINHRVWKMACSSSQDTPFPHPKLQCPPLLPAHLPQLQPHTALTAFRAKGTHVTHMWRTCDTHVTRLPTADGATQPLPAHPPGLQFVLTWNLNCRLIELDVAEKGKLKTAGYAVFWK